MCFFLYIASPLTLSEVRSMLPAGVAADLVSASARAAFQALHPPTKTVARLLVGSCSCDLVRPRVDDPVEDERELRARYRAAKLSRAEVIRELEWHRRGPSRSQPRAGWAETLAGFVVEHARNAGPTLYYLDFSPALSEPSSFQAAAARSCSVEEVRLQPERWLIEGRWVLVS